MSKHDRLCLLQVGKAGADALDVLLGLVHQRLLQAQHFNGQGAHVVTQEQPQVVGGLVVARTTGTQLATQGAEALGQQALDEGVDVFVIQGRGDAASAKICADAFQGVEHGQGFLLAQQPGALQFPGMGLGAGQVVRGQSEVAFRATGQGRQGFGRAAFEASTPETVGGLGHCCFSSSVTRTEMGNPGRNVAEKNRRAKSGQSSFQGGSCNGARADRSVSF
nr:hypothetical protein GCM10020185_86110 [Pseudomonas brassicacearum subsp. brassicacearum]